MLTCELVTYTVLYRFDKVIKTLDVRVLLVSECKLCRILHNLITRSLPNTTNCLNVFITLF